MLKSYQIASLICKAAKQQNVEINYRKMQILTYCCYGTYYAMFDNLLFMNEKFLIGETGPYLSNLSTMCLHFSIEDFANKNVPNHDSKIDYVVDEVIKAFGKYSTNQLINWVTCKGSPWRVCLTGWLNFKTFNDPISDELIFKQFAKYVSR